MTHASSDSLWQLVRVQVLCVALAACASACLVDEERADSCASDNDCRQGYTCVTSSAGLGVCVGAEGDTTSDLSDTSSGDTVAGDSIADDTSADDTSAQDAVSVDTLADTAVTDTASGDTALDVDDGVDAISSDADTSGPGLPFRYVRINDLSDTADTVNGGADIDAVILDKADGTQFFATTVEQFQHGGGVSEGPDLDPTEALGAPDSFSNYTSGPPVCDVSRGYVSLGGQGGLLVVGMGAELEAGDEITVLEIGGCTGNDGPQGIVEEVQVQIAASFDLDGQWVTLGSGEGPVIKFTVPVLPAD